MNIFLKDLENKCSFVIGLEITFTQNHVIGGLIGGLLTRVFFLQFCDVTKLAITHKKIKQNLSIN
jgi:hypothetical protein